MILADSQLYMWHGGSGGTVEGRWQNEIAVLVSDSTFETGQVWGIGQRIHAVYFAGDDKITNDRRVPDAFGGIVGLRHQVNVIARRLTSNVAFDDGYSQFVERVMITENKSQLSEYFTSDFTVLKSDTQAWRERRVLIGHEQCCTPVCTIPLLDVE